MNTIDMSIIDHNKNSLSADLKKEGKPCESKHLSAEVSEMNDDSDVEMDGDEQQLQSKNEKQFQRI